MEAFVKKQKDISHKSNTSVKEREKQYKGTFHADDNRLFCIICNLVVDHSRKSTLEKHVKSVKHIKRANKCESDVPPKQQKTMPTTFRNVTVAEQSRIAVTHDWVEALASANVPLIKSDHPRIREFLNKHVKNGGSIPGYNQLQDAYMPDVYKCERQKLTELLKDKKLAVIFDEMSDDEGRFVLNILFAPLEVDNQTRVIAYLADSVLNSNQSFNSGTGCRQTYTGIWC